MITKNDKIEELKEEMRDLRQSLKQVSEQLAGYYELRNRRDDLIYEIDGIVSELKKLGVSVE
ncbi:hypothetical protein P9E09_20050 [Bacillus mojavensis]|uniref:hypothetical protein n=1 Tax=Bacillus mojavensis TaxID=72360 RepID=UPI002DBFFEED|nr:hypothetical protein [Bacillus mojavensis]MEC1709850.1 hypothetical protein [Bacillus mojavensis]